MQVVLGIPLEMVHSWWRVLIIYVAGVIAGSLGTSVVDPSVYLAGASGGVYALLLAHLASLILVIHSYCSTTYTRKSHSSLSRFTIDFPQNWKKFVLMSELVQDCGNIAIFKQICTLKCFIAFQMANFCCFSLWGKLDFLQKITAFDLLSRLGQVPYCH